MPAYLGSYDDTMGVCLMEPSGGVLGSRLNGQLKSRLDTPASRFDASPDGGPPSSAKVPNEAAQSPREEAAVTGAAENVAMVTGSKPKGDTKAPGTPAGAGNGGTDEAAAVSGPQEVRRAGGRKGEERPTARALPRAGVPETGPVALRWGSVQLSANVPPYLASTALGIEPAKPPAAPGEKQDPLPKLPDYRRAYAAAIEDGARFHALIRNAARTLASRARDQNEECKQRQENTLNVSLHRLDDGLSFNRTNLLVGRDMLLGRVQGLASSLRAQVSAAAGKAHGLLSGKVAGYQLEIGTLKVAGDKIALKAFGGIGAVDKSGKAAVEALDKMKKAIPERYPTDGDFLKWAVRNEAIQDFLPPRVERLRKNTEDTRKNVVDQLGRTFGCLQCNIDGSRQAFEYSTTAVEKPAHEAVDAAAAGGYKAITAAADQLTLAIHESFARSDAALVEQHRAMRSGAIDTAQHVARQERAGLADAATRQVASLAAVAGGQASASAKVHETLKRDKTLTEPAFASSVTQAATRLAQNIGNVAKVHPRTTMDAAEKLQAGRRQRAAGFERQQQATALHTERNFDKIVSESLGALDRHIAETSTSLRSVPTDVRNSANSSLQPLDDAFFNGLADYRDSMSGLSASVEAVFSLEAPAKVEPSQKREQPKPKDGEVKGDQAGDGKGKSASKAPAPPAPPASCAGCPPPEEKEKAPKKQEGNDPNLTGKQPSDGSGSSKSSDGKTGAGKETPAPNPASPNQFIKSSEKIALDPWGVGPFASFVEGAYDKVSQEVNKRAKTINAKMSWSTTNRAAIVKELTGITKLQGQAIEEYYNFIWDPDLREALDKQLRSVTAAGSTDDANVDEATKALDGDVSGSAFSGLTAAFNYSNEFDRAKQILLDMTPAQLEEMRRNHGSELEGFANELYGDQKEIFKALISGHPEEARAIELRRDLDKNDYKEAQARADANDKLVEDALSEPFAQAAYMDKDAATADAFGMEGAFKMDVHAAEYPQLVVDRRKEHVEKMVTAFGLLPGVVEMGGNAQINMPGAALYQYATRTTDWNLDYYKRYPPPPGSPAEQRMKWLEANPNPHSRREMAPANKLVFEMMLRHGPNSEEAKGARLLKERRRSGDPKVDDLDKALHVGSGDAVEGGGYDKEKREKGRKKAEEERDRIFLLSEKFRYQLEGGDPPPKEAKEARAKVEAEIAKAYPKDEKARAVALGIVRSEEGDFEAVVEYAASKEKTELLTKYLNRRDRTEIEAFSKKYNATHAVPIEKRLGLFEHHWSMDNMNGAVFSGDKANKLEIAWMGVPQNTKERSEVALRIMDQAIDQAGGLGKFLASGEFAQLEANARSLREAMGVTPDQVDSRGRIRKTDPLTGLPVDYGHFDEKGELRQEYKGDSNMLAVAMGMSQMYADNYAEATDRIANFVTTALIVAAAIITTALTGGAAASIWLPMLVTAGAGLVGIGLTASIKGGRYGRDDLVRDLAMTVVQTLTAGIGAAGSVAARGGMPALRAVASRGVSQGFRISEKALERFVVSKGGSLAASASFGAELGIAAGSGALSGGVVAALDPANKDSGEYGSRILGGMFRGAAGSMVGAGAARGVATGLGAVGNRIAGAAASRSASSALASGLSREQALERALLAARRAQWMSGGVTRAISSGASGSVSKMTELGLEGKASWDQILAEGRTAFIQNMLQGAVEHGADPGTRNPFGKGARLSDSDLKSMPSWQRGEHAQMQAMAEKAVGRAFDAPAAARPRQPVPEAPFNDNERRTARLAADEPEGRVTIPVRPLEEAGVPLAGRTALTEEPGSLTPAARLRGTEEEPVAMLRSAAAPREEEPPARLRSASDWDDEKTNPAIPVKHPEFPDGVDLKPGMLNTMPHILPETVVRPVNPKDGVQARQNYDLMRTHTPDREVLLAHNPTTGDYMVVQGMPNSVKPPPEGWVTLRHSHPKLDGGDEYSHFCSVLPSGIGGDFSVLRNELDRMPGANLGVEVRRASVIDIEVNGKHIQTTFEITRKGDNYSLTVTLEPAMHGVSSLGPFTGDRHESLRQYAYKARDLTSGGSDFGLGHNTPPRENLMSPGVDAPARVVRNATLSEAERHDALFIAGRMAQTEAFDQQARGAAPRGELDPVIARAATSLDAQDRVRAMGLVGRTDSLERLTRLLNSADPAFTPEMRSALARATLEATRSELIRTGNLAPGDELLMLFRGVTGARTDDYEQGGMDLSRLGPGGDEDAGRGLYGSQDFQSALNYAGNDGRGVVLPLIVRRSELGNVIDVRSGTPLGDRWLAYVRATAKGGVVKETHPHLSRVLYPFTDSPIGVYRDGRGDRFEAFLRTLADDPTLPPAVREAARDPHITLMDLGGVASWGNDRSMLTDQFAMHHQRILDLFNDAHGFPGPGRPAAAEEGPVRLRSALDGPEGEGDGPEPTAPQPPRPEDTADAEPPAPAKAIATNDNDEDVVAVATRRSQESVAEDYFDAVMAANADLHAIKPPASTYHEAMSGASHAQRRAWHDRAMAEFAMHHPAEFARLQALIGNDIPAIRNAISAANDQGREQQIVYLVSRMKARGHSEADATRIAREVIGLASDMHHRFALTMRQLVEQEIWSDRIAGLPAAVRAMTEGSSLLLYLGAHHPTLLQDLHTRFLAQPSLDPAMITRAHFEEFVAGRLAAHPAVQAETTGRRIVRFASEAEFNAAAANATPNTRYEFERLAYTTDEHGRVAVAEGVPVRVRGHRGSSSLQTAIGNRGFATDVGFHLIAHIFGAVVNELTVVAGNGKRIPGDPEPNLNGSAYKVRFENIVRGILDTTTQIVEVQVVSIYDSGNISSRPDRFVVRFRTDAGRWIVVPFVNKF